MSSLRLLLVAVVLVVVISTSFIEIVSSEKSLVPINTENEEIGLKILGGCKAKPGAFPYYASIYRNHEFKCGGVIIGVNYILTAAHCFGGCIAYNNCTQENLLKEKEETEPIITVRVGDVINSQLDGDYEIPAFKVIKHKLFDCVKTWPYYDIAIIRLMEPIEFRQATIVGDGKDASRTIAPIDMIDLPDSEVSYLPGEPMIVIGWGKDFVYNNDSHRPEYLKYLETYYTSDEDCAESFDEPLMNNIEPQFICTRQLDGGTGPCFGDSGGPLVREREFHHELVGLVSGAPKCRNIPCGGNYPTAYTKVSSYLHWIEAKISKLDDEFNEFAKKIQMKRVVADYF